MPRPGPLGALQLQIMQVLWDRGEATVAEVRESLAANRALAHTTVATMLTKLEQKGHLTHRTEGRANVYRPLVKQDRMSRSMVSDLTQRLCAGDVTQMVSLLLDGCQVTPEELQRLKDLIARKEQEQQEAPHA